MLEEIGDPWADREEEGNHQTQDREQEPQANVDPGFGNLSKRWAGVDDERKC